MKNENVLGYIMNLLNISGKELALTLDVDTAVLSKWKNNKRKINSSSEYPQKIVECFFGKEFLGKRKYILQVMKPEVPDIESKSEEEQKVILAGMLNNPITENRLVVESVKKDYYSTNIEVMTDHNNGWYGAYERFMDMTESTNFSDNMILEDFGGVDWNEVEGKYFCGVSKRITSLVESGKEVIIIDLLKDSYRSYKAVSRWLPMYMLKGVKVYYINEWDVDEKNCYVFMLGDKITLHGRGGKKDVFGGVYDIFVDSANTEYYWKRGLEDLSKARKMIHLFDIENMIESIQLLNKNLKVTSEVYMLNPAPTFINMPEQLLEEIIKDNHIADDKREKIMEINFERTSIRSVYRYCQIYDMDHIERLVMEERVREPMLSLIARKDVYVTRKQFLSQLMYIVEQLERENYTVLVPSFQNDLQLEQDQLSVTVQEDSLVMCWNASEYESIIYSMEPTFVGGFVDYSKKLLSSVPVMKRNKEWTKKRLTAIVNNMSINKY